MPIVMYFTQQGFLCRSLNAIVSKDVGIEPRIATELVITATFHQMHSSYSILADILWLLSFHETIYTPISYSMRLSCVVSDATA